MSKANRMGWMALGGIAALLAAGVSCIAQASGDNPYRPVRGLADGGGPSVPGGEWARLPGGGEMGLPASIHVDVDGESIWAVIRCDETSRCRPRRAAASASSATASAMGQEETQRSDPSRNVISVLDCPDQRGGSTMPRREVIAAAGAALPTRREE